MFKVLMDLMKALCKTTPEVGDKVNAGCSRKWSEALYFFMALVDISQPEMPGGYGHCEEGGLSAASVAVVGVGVPTIDGRPMKMSRDMQAMLWYAADTTPKSKHPVKVQFDSEMDRIFDEFGIRLTAEQAIAAHVILASSQFTDLHAMSSWAAILCGDLYARIDLLRTRHLDLADEDFLL